MPKETAAYLIGRRLKFARERAGITQHQLAAVLRLEHRQSLAAIEAGERRLTAEELLLAMQALGTDLDYFTDAFRLIGEGQFSFRARPGVAAHVLEEFEDRAGRWIATYRALGVESAEASDWLVPKLVLTKRSTFEEAASAGESVAARWKLGDVPSRSLQSALERELDALVLFVDAPVGISGAASQLPRLNSVLVNRNEPAGRRNFDLAHELFHLLTWDTMPPERVEAVEVPRGGKGNRVERLAENFAAALLMPSAVITARWQQRDTAGDLHQWLNGTAAELGVSAVALKWRLFNLECLGKADLVNINDQRLAASGAAVAAPAAERLFSARFVRRIAQALDTGRLSVRRAAALLTLTIPALASLLRDYGVEPSFEA